MTTPTLLGLPRPVPASPPWRSAWDTALYGPGGFFRREIPADHFRTSVTASSVLAEGIAELLRRTGLRSVVDLGAGRGELLADLHRTDPTLDLHGVEVRPRPASLPAGIGWHGALPAQIDGLVVAHEWLDNIPCHVAEVDDAGAPRLLHVDPATGRETPGARLDDAVAAPGLAAWVDRWWPLHEPGQRAEIGSTRDRALTGVMERIGTGLLLAIDYGHDVSTRPFHGSLRSYRHGRQVPVVPDGTRDVTADVATDAAAAAVSGRVHRQRDALRALGVTGADRSADDQLAALARRGEVAEVLDASGLGGFDWIVAPRGLDDPLG